MAAATKDAPLPAVFLFVVVTGHWLGHWCKVIEKMKGTLFILALICGYVIGEWVRGREGKEGKEREEGGMKERKKWERTLGVR